MNEGLKDGYPLKRRYFAAIGSYSVKTVTDRYSLVAYRNKHCDGFKSIDVDKSKKPVTVLVTICN